MSLDVSYYSFSPSRADQRWPEIREDLPALREDGLAGDAYYRQQRTVDEQVRKYKETVLNPRLVLAREEILEYIKKKNYADPYYGWEMLDDPRNDHMRDSLMDYLQTYGCLYPPGADPKDKNAPYFQPRVDEPELLEKYQKVKQENEELLSRFRKSLKQSQPSAKSALSLTARQEGLGRAPSLNYLLTETEFNQERLLGDFVGIDIHYGAEANRYFESPKLEYSQREALVNALGLPDEDGYPSKEAWINLFMTMTPEKITQVSRWFIKYNSGWELEDAEEELKEYLRAVKPVVKDLKETADAVFVVWSGDGLPVVPTGVNDFLVQRAKNHAREYQGLLPPVL